MSINIEEEMRKYDDSRSDFHSVTYNFIENTELYVRYFDSHELMFSFVKDKTPPGKYYCTCFWPFYNSEPLCELKYEKQEDGSFVVTHFLDSEFPVPIDYAKCSFSYNFSIVNHWALQSNVPVVIVAKNCIIYPFAARSFAKGDIRKLKDE
jgi:hypothetical protein